MLKNYFKIAWRNLYRNKAFSAINIAGLAVGMAGTILIYTWIQHQLSYDQFHANKGTLYKLWLRSADTTGQIYCSDITSGPVGAALKQEFPEVQDVSRIYWPIDRLFSYRDKIIKAEGRDVDKPFLTMFSFPLIEGDPKHALDEVNSVVITESLARKLFDNESPMYKVINIDKKQTCQITGVMKDLPYNTEFKFDYLVSLTANENFYSAGNNWNNNTYQTFVQLKPGVDVKRLGQKIADINERHTDAVKAQLFLHPITQWHLYSNFENGKATGGLIDVVRLVALIGGLILLVACINFMNLSTARSEKRAKEVGVRKVMGAQKMSLVAQFLSESILIAIVAGMLALILVALCLPAFNRFTQENLTVNYSSPVFIVGMLGFIVLTGALAGSYPAFFLSAFKPVKVLKGKFREGHHWFTPRKVLVVVQFTVAIVMVVSTLVVYRQIQFAQQRDSGYVKNNLIDIGIEGDMRKNYDLIKHDLIQSGAATGVSQNSFSVTQPASTSNSYRWTGENAEQPDIEFTRFNTTGDFISTLGIKLVQGRDIDLAMHPSDTAAVLLNETAVKQMQLKNPLGHTIYFSRMGDKPITVVGVFKDFIIGSPYSPVSPMIVHGLRNWNYNMVVRLNAHNSTAKNLQLAGDVFKKYNPSYPFEYKFVDQRYAEKFANEVKTGTLAALFAGLTIFISCLGLFGLAAYMAENRSKEIGIRRVLGASVSSVIQLLTAEFVVLVVIALAIATPIGWWVMHNWLQNYTYHVTVGWFTFAMAGVTAILLAVGTVSMQAVRAANANPVDSMRAE
ncbi:ABC transporter permease [Mucilaginibacter sp. PAMB04168]|uniref:ABC transporter permease n=1 Tax=Mucilaginibacter sp. PAMB04168 TaxID=3138567 RepID=UPI0031F6A107